jgi:glycosyltransferase involved in cell wall biosynthesis
MRRILLLITDLQIGGTPTVVRELATRLNAAGGTSVDVACLSPMGPVGEQLRAAGVAVHALDARGPRDLARTVSRLRKLIRANAYDTIFSFLVHANVVAALAGRPLPGVRLLQSIQTTQPRPRWHWVAQRIAARAAERIVVPSPSVAAVAEQWARVPREKIDVIPNAIDLDAFAGLTSNPRTDGVKRIGFIGRLDPIKRVPLLVASLAELPAEWRLDIFGEGQERSTIERAIAGRSLQDRVTLHGPIDRPQSALSQIDVLVLPSLAEGFGLVLIEAMAAGVPVVAANVAGIRDVVRDGENGLLVDPTDPHALAAAIVRATTDQRARLVANGRVAARDRYGWSNVLAAYQRLLGIP